MQLDLPIYLPKNLTLYVNAPQCKIVILRGRTTLVPLGVNFNANGSVRWRTSAYLNLFHWPMGKNSGNRNGVCRYVPVGYVGQPIILVTLKVILPETIGTIP